MWIVDHLLRWRYKHEITDLYFPYSLHISKLLNCVLHGYRLFLNHPIILLLLITTSVTHVALRTVNDMAILFLPYRSLVAANLFMLLVHMRSVWEPMRWMSQVPSRLLTLNSVRNAPKWHVLSSLSRGSPVRSLLATEVFSLKYEDESEYLALPTDFTGFWYSCNCILTRICDKQVYWTPRMSGPIACLNSQSPVSGGLRDPFVGSTTLQVWSFGQMLGIKHLKLTLYSGLDIWVVRSPRRNPGSRWITEDVGMGIKELACGKLRIWFIFVSHPFSITCLEHASGTKGHVP